MYIDSLVITHSKFAILWKLKSKLSSAQFSAKTKKTDFKCYRIFQMLNEKLLSTVGLAISEDAK